MPLIKKWQLDEHEAKTDIHHAQLHKDSHKMGGGDAFTVNDFLDAIAKVEIRKNTGASDVGARRRLNFIEGANVTLTVVDDPANEEVDLTIASAGGAGIPSDTVVTEKSFGQSEAPGTAAAYSRGDHTHGSPPDPIPGHNVASGVHGVGAQYLAKTSRSDQLTDHANLANVLADQHHRQWGWADEQSWIKSFVLPVADQYDWQRYAGNPILDVGASGKFDDKSVWFGSIVYQGGYYYLFYSGQKTSDNKNRTGVARATSPTGPFTRLNNGDPIIDVGGTGAPDELDAYRASVIYDEFETDANKKWKCLYLGKKADATLHCMYAYSASPDSGWTKYGEVTGMTNFAYGASLNRFGRLYHSAYSRVEAGAYEFWHALSKDCITWTPICVIASKGATGEWDSYGLFNGTIFWNLGVWYMFYSGSTDGALSRIGMTTGVTGWTSYTKFPRNPVLGAAASGWDNHSVNPWSLIMVDNKFYMYYHGRSTAGATPYKIGVATVP